MRALGLARHDEAMTPTAELLTAQGQELLGVLSERSVTPDEEFRLAAELRSRYPAGLVAAALAQVELREAGRAKFSRASEMLFTREGLEQASSELTAAHTARRFAGRTRIADLCCGIGGNLAALAGTAGQVVAVEADLTALALARWNVAVQRAAAAVAPICADVRDLALGGGRGGLDGLFIDPARRSGGRRLRTGDSHPPLDWCLRLASLIPAVGIKAAPGLARDRVPPGWEAEFIAVGRGLKEALLWSPALASTQRRATILPGGATLVSRSGPPVPVCEPGGYLLDPNPAVTRAGLVAELARDVGAWQIDPMIAFLSADKAVRTPFARTLRVLDSFPWRERQAGRRLRELGIGVADIRRRGLAGDVQQIHKRLNLRGEHSATIVLTRREAAPWCLICTDVAAGS